MFVSPGANAPSYQNLDQLDSSFMYTKILKEILLESDYDEQSIQDLTAYCREQYIDNRDELKNIAKFEREYRHKSPIWWYSYECFLRPMLNRALRTQDVDIIIKMGFFIRDIHQQIGQLHSKQFGDPHAIPFIVYRGQGMSSEDFENLKRKKDGLISFNNILSTCIRQDVSLEFARHAVANPECIGVLFKMTIDPLIFSVPFAGVDQIGYYPSDGEILFSMHTVFRIGDIKKLDDTNRLWLVELKLTSDTDQSLDALTELLREETQGPTARHRIGQLLMKLGECDKAEQVYLPLLEQTPDTVEKAHLYHQLGVIKNSLGEYVEAISFFEKALEIKQQTLPPNHPDLAPTYDNIGSMYNNMSEYSKALSFFEKALEIKQQTLPPNHPDLAPTYDNIGSVYNNMSEYSKALSFFEKALEIKQQTLPPNHPDLATTYDNIGSMYNSMSEYSKALSFFGKALEIKQQTLPPNHPDLATTYDNIGSMYNSMSEYSKALSFFEKALEIKQQTLPPNHPDLAQTYDNIGLAYSKAGEYSKALTSHEKALEIRQKALPTNHPDLGQTYNNIGLTYQNMGEYSKALSFYDRAVEIAQRSLSLNHPHFQMYKKNLESVKKEE